MFKTKYIVAGLAAFAMLVFVSQLRQCAGPAPAPTHIHPAPAPAASAAPKPTPVAPPTGIKSGYAERRVVGQDQYGQWTTLADATVQLGTIDVTVPALPEGTQGKRRTEYIAWIRTAEPTAQVLLHVVGYTADAMVQIDDWHSSPLRHSNAWTTDPSVGRYVVSLAPGWHHVVMSVTRARGYVDGPVSVRMQFGSASLDPTVPVPYAVPADATPAPAATSAPAAAVSITGDGHAD